MVLLLLESLFLIEIKVVVVVFNLLKPPLL